MLSLLDRYAELMKSRCHTLIMKTIDEEDDYVSLIVLDQEELEEVMNAFTISNEILTQNIRRDNSLSFPKTLPFSRGFPQTCVYIKEMIVGFYQFADGFSQQNHEIDDLLKKTLENLLLGINSAYHDKIENAALSVVYQLMMNLSFLEEACGQFEDLIIEKRFQVESYRSYLKGGKSSLLAAKLFVETRSLANHRIHTIINKKNDSFLELLDYDWKTTQPRRHASPYLSGMKITHNIIIDLMSFFNTVMTTTLVELPPKSKGLLYFEAFNHLATSIKVGEHTYSLVEYDAFVQG
jgi:hypothetical protein